MLSNQDGALELFGRLFAKLVLPHCLTTIVDDLFPVALDFDDFSHHMDTPMRNSTEFLHGTGF